MWTTLSYVAIILRYSLVYNRESDEVYAGGIGFIQEWKVTGAEVTHRKCLLVDSVIRAYHTNECKTVKIYVSLF